MSKILPATQSGKSGISATGLMLNVTKCLPATEQYLFARAINATSAARSMCNLFVTKVLGPAQPIYFVGPRLESLAGLSPLGDGCLRCYAGRVPVFEGIFQAKELH